MKNFILHNYYIDKIIVIKKIIKKIENQKEIVRKFIKPVLY
jgi:hypothetical protein